MILPIQQDPADLALTLVTHKLDAALTIFKQTTLSIGAWTITFHIIGESHLVTIEHAGTPILTELLACVAIDNVLPLHAHPFSDLKPHQYTRAGYSIAVSFSDTPPNAALNNPAGMLEMAFPTIAGQTPVTRITWARTSDHSLSWETLHIYPHAEQTVYVRSLSHFDTIDYNRTS